MASKRTPSALSVELLKQRGYIVQKVEYWNPFARRRIDLFGCIDIVAIKHGEILGVQTTSWANVSSRLNKIHESKEMLMWVKAGGQIEVHGWKGSAKSPEVKITMVEAWD